jgi:hypothetical protein
MPISRRLLSLPHAAQAAKTTLFAAGNGADVRKTAAGQFFQLTTSVSDLRWLTLRRPQKRRFLRPATELVSEKRPQASFSN